MLSQEEIEWVDDYLRGNLTESELVDFHNRLSNDKYFKKEVDHLKSISDNFERIAIKESLVELERSFNNSNLKSITRNIFNSPKRTISIAASVILLVGASVFFTLNNKKKPNNFFGHNFNQKNQNLDSLFLLNDSTVNSSKVIKSINDFFKRK
jgi:hypothetical protein